MYIIFAQSERTFPYSKSSCVPVPFPPGSRPVPVPVCAVQYFETDDQEFYKTKVCFILNNDVSEMDLVFAEEKYSKAGQLEKVKQHYTSPETEGDTKINTVHL